MPPRPTGPGQPRPTRAAGLRLAPFYGVRYAPGEVSGIANVTSPPYDVIGTGIREHLLSADPHNVIRLILPDAAPGAGSDPAAEAAARLREWVASGILVRDPAPGIYIYEQNDGSGLPQRGLISLVGVGSGILPHEDVMPGPVAGRRELMAATQANLEPIFLLYDGSSDVASFIDSVASTRSPLLTASVAGSQHRLWVVDDPAEVILITSGLEGREALIADGHHRYAAYQQLRDSAGGPGPWDYGLAFLVDSAAYPPRIGAVHRVLPDLPPRQAVALARSAFTVRPLTGDLPAALRALDAEPGAAFVLAGDDSFWLVSRPSEELDAAVLQDLLIGQAWGIEDNEREVQVAHDPDEAVRAVAEGGTAVLSRPIPFDVVRGMAARGERVPRKSTSFSPKPRTGLVLRYWGSPVDSAPTRASSTVS